MPAVSVITPTYNRAHVLPRAIESLRRQTFEEYEHIIVDDASTDRTPDIIDTYRDDRTRHIQLPENEGAATALNHGLDAATGEYISILDSDDEYHPNRLERTVGWLEECSAEIGGLAHSFERRREWGTRTRHVPAGRIELEDMAESNRICGSTNTIYRASVCEDVGGFDDHLKSSVDYDFQLRVLENTSLIGLDEVLSRKDDTVAGMQQNPELLREGLERLVAKHRNALSDRNLAYRYRKLGRVCLDMGEGEMARRWFERALETAPEEAGALHYEIGRAYWRVDRVTAARSHLRKSVRADSDDFRPYALYLVSLVPISGPQGVEKFRLLHDVIEGYRTSIERYRSGRANQWDAATGS